jgi:hypothetical protein
VALAGGHVGLLRFETHQMGAESGAHRIGAATAPSGSHEEGADAVGTRQLQQAGEVVVGRLPALDLDRHLAQPVVAGEVGPARVLDEEGTAAVGPEHGRQLAIEGGELTGDVVEAALVALAVRRIETAQGGGDGAGLDRK